MKIFGQLAVTEIQGKYIWSPFTTRSSSPFACQNGLQQHKKMSLEGINRKSYNVVGQWCNNDNARWRRKNLSLSWIINNGFLVLEHLAGRIFRFLFIIFYFSLIKKFLSNPWSTSTNYPTNYLSLNFTKAWKFMA